MYSQLQEITPNRLGKKISLPTTRRTSPEGRQTARSLQKLGEFRTASPKRDLTKQRGNDTASSQSIDFKLLAINRKKTEGRREKSRKKGFEPFGLYPCFMIIFVFHEA
jgi:hypothetical protein